MLKQAMVEVAYDLLEKKQGPQKFIKFWNEVSDVLSMSEEERDQNVSKFYTKLTLDERFVLLEDNMWDLRERQSFEKVHIDMNDIYSEIEDEEKELAAEKEEEGFYDDEDTTPDVDASEDDSRKVDEEEEDY